MTKFLIEIWRTITNDIQDTGHFSVVMCVRILRHVMRVLEEQMTRWPQRKWNKISRQFQDVRDIFRFFYDFFEKKIRVFRFVDFLRLWTLNFANPQHFQDFSCQYCSIPVHLYTHKSRHVFFVANLNAGICALGRRRISLLATPYHFLQE